MFRKVQFQVAFESRGKVTKSRGDAGRKSRGLWAYLGIPGNVY